MEIFQERLRLLLGVLYSGQALQEAETKCMALKKRWEPYGVKKARNLTEQDAMLITYGDAVAEDGEAPLFTLNRFLQEYCSEGITDVHLLPICPYTSDDGFSVSDYTRIDPALGGWEDVEALSSNFGVMLDAVVNHTSKSHAWFQNCLKGAAPYKDYYIACDPSLDYSSVTRPRPLPLLTKFQTPAGEKWYWTTFSDDQVDVNFASPDLLCEIIDVLLSYAGRGAKFIRLDAVGFAWKQLGTSCMHLPQTHAVVKLFRHFLNQLFPGVYLITETNVPHLDNIRYFGQGDEADLVYQFPLPPLVLFTFLTGNATKLSKWADSLRETSLPEGTAYFNFLASHDGVGVRPTEGILNEKEREFLLEAAISHGGRVSYKQNADGSQSPYELNINYCDALTPSGATDSARIARFLAAQAILLSLQGVPGIYYHSLLGSRNWVKGMEKSGISRRINREKLEYSRLIQELNEPGSFRHKIFFGFLELLKIRRRQPAFSPFASQRVLDFGPSIFAVARESARPGQKLLALVNVTGNTAGLNETLTGEDLLNGDKPVSIRSLSPYQICWLKLAEE